jgi:hypothetical protein
MNCDVDVGKARLGRTRGETGKKGQARFSWVLGQRLTMTFKALGMAGIRKELLVSGIWIDHRTGVISISGNNIRYP